MKNLNRVTLLGVVMQLGVLKNDPTITPRFEFSLTTTHHWIDPKTGELCYDKETHDIVLFDKKAPHAARMMRVGSIVMIEGYIKTIRREVGNNLEPLMIKKIICSNFIVCGKRNLELNNNEVDEDGF